MTEAHELLEREASPFELRWRTYQLVFAAASLGMVPLILTGRDFNWPTVLPLLALCVGFAALAVIQGVLRRVTAWVEGLGLGLGLVLFALRYLQILAGVAAGRLPPEALADIFPWAGVLYAATFVVLPGRRALMVSLVVLAFVSATGFMSLLGSAEVRGFEPMFDLTVSGGILILLLAVFRRTADAGIRAEAKAEMMAALATRDSLTGLYNRRYLEARLSEEFARAERYGHPLTLAMADIDDFKQINDRFSHQVGDHTLQRLASLLLNHTRESDLVVRYGGEEFVIAFLDTPLAEAVRACENVCEQIRRHDWTTIHPQLSVTLSIGVSGDVDFAGHQQLLHQADLKLYQAKHRGKDQVRY